MQEIDNAENIIEVQNISFSYGSEEIIKDISFGIHKSHYLGLIGPNGAGKTTLLKIILGLLKPDSGTIKIFGKDIKEFKEWWRIGYVPQKATNFDVNFPITVQEVALMGRYSKRGLFHATNRKDKELVSRALKQVEMWELRDRLIGDLSGGQQQRVFIARALAAEPEIIFLDEPTTGVDQKSQDDFYTLLRKLNKELHLTLVLISHDIERVTAEANHIACINRALVCYESPEQFIKESHEMALFGEHVKVITEHHHHQKKK